MSFVGHARRLRPRGGRTRHQADGEAALEIPGVEYIYSTSSPGGSLAIVRFKVGQDEEKSIVNLNQKMFANFDLIPPGATQPLIKPRSIDDVPILALTFSSDRYGPFELRRVAARCMMPSNRCRRFRRRHHRWRPPRAPRHARRSQAGGLRALAPAGVCALVGSNRRLESGKYSGRQPRVPARNRGVSCAPLATCAMWWWPSPNGRPVFVRDVAEVSDGGGEPSEYVEYAAHGHYSAAVTLAISKRKSTNAIDVAAGVLTRVETLKGTVIPSDVDMHVTRNYGARPPKSPTSCCCTCSSRSSR